MHYPWIVVILKLSYLALLSAAGFKNHKSILNLSRESPIVNLNCKVCSSYMVRKYTLRWRSTIMEEEEAAVLNLTNFKDLSNSKAVCIKSHDSGDRVDVGGLHNMTSTESSAAVSIFVSLESLNRKYWFYSASKTSFHLSELLSCSGAS